MCFSDYDNALPSIEDGVNVLKNAKLHIGHNLIGFDLPVVDRLYGSNLLLEGHIHDTLIMSQVLRYKRGHRHGLKGWGESIDNSKIEYDDWSQYSREMLRYCKQDVMLNVDIYHRLLAEYKKAAEFRPLIKEGMQIEHEAGKFNTFIRDKGWYFDMDEAKSLLGTMHQRMAEIENCLLYTSPSPRDS